MQASEEELKAFVRSRLAAFKVPVRIVMLDDTLPRNANGKILKKALRPYFDTPA
jgi:long-chain acyl-CoA synthetase